MDAGASAADQAMHAVTEAYFALLVSVPLVLAGVALTGSAFYFAFVRRHVAGRGVAGWLRYLFPWDNYTTASAKIDIAPKPSTATSTWRARAICSIGCSACSTSRAEGNLALGA